MRKPIHFMLAFLVLLCCATEDESNRCKDSGACNNCFKIYDSEGNYINGGSISGDSPYAYWNGTNCNGDSVSCGKYIVEYNFQGQSITDDIVVSGPNAIVKNTRSACDSLKKICNGFYYEEESILGPTCICCQ